ncbi:Helix-turn-helix domain-containing protein [Collimonas sp. OK242]|uniref:hypothetical protein n=1 Tax=Collimonas sp. OK242 TaxID=1798195 RepID=UPI000896F764|nr:hypothetical protein [Collimonas sp. OK242]SDX63042.1 Helix-turn-helix domain-containing protein [Collimonas sp. OK242]
MPSPTYPMPNTLAARLLTAMLNNDMHRHPEFVQSVGPTKLAAAVKELRSLGWSVEMFEVHAPIEEDPHRHVAFYYLADAEHTLRAAFGSEEGL